MKAVDAFFILCKQNMPDTVKYPAENVSKCWT